MLLIMTDDQGFGAPSTFGGVIPMPTMDRIAKEGLRFTNFHSTSLCSPTRAALITGRNHHSVGYGVVGKIATGYPGYDSIIPIKGPELEHGRHRITFDYKADGTSLGVGGTGVLSVDGNEVARNSLEHGIPVTFPEDETFDVGLDTRTGVALVEYRYDTPFKFTGKIDKLIFELERSNQ
ncbi:hypothetical protein BN77_2457 [Rhizobium mesoamericanum STM3625]|uniref:Sulfatase N-terminal domain-containing protein n=1 Tax=Rhizobium mesoamericanum STM3625 TaxID=1211777 RepID=K0PMX3_9HYPH|nr:hypothetical protein BN77_2457 [Rhizobium mesoamericanum STM3625]